MKVVLCGFLIHVIFLLSIFDIYFKSPIVKDISVLNGIRNPPAKRLVLFVADGLRADSVFSVNNNEYLSPNIRSIIEKRGMWGVAHSRVPTESRPGHIAMIAGFYEDPSAVFTGWKDNLVEFDSVFNQSHVTYSWGSPDILPMFKKGAIENKVHTFCYTAEEQDFSGYGSTKLNTWVFEKFEQFLLTAKDDPALSDSLNYQGVVFFLHLLGPDVAGHSSKPHSREYKENINVVDSGVKRVEELISEFYGHDNKTAFIYTSDHGMTDWGSHGAGSESETDVPLVVWGAGCGKPRPQDTSSASSFTPERWRLRHLHRSDVAQADLCPLMATLIGIPIPVNSVGVLPADFLALTDKEKSAAMVTNAYQLTAQYDRKRNTVESNLISWLYKSFPELTRAEEQSLRENITRLTDEGKFDEVMEKSKLLIKLSLAGLEYYHSYFQSLLLCCISLSFLGWIACLFCQLLHVPEKRITSQLENILKRKNKISWADIIFFFLSVSVIFLIYVQSLPVQYNLYCCLPLVLWWAVFDQSRSINFVCSYRPIQVVCSAVLYLILLELLVLTFFKRWVLSVVVAIIGFWPFSLQERRNLIPHKLQFYWLFSFSILAVFPVLPVVGQQTQPDLVVACGGLWVLLGLATLYVLGVSKLGWSAPLQLAMLSVATAVIYSTAKHFSSNVGLQLLNQVIAWVLLVISLTIPLLTSNEIPARFFSIGLGLAVPFLLLCVGHEAYFFLSLFVSVCIWLCIEACLEHIKVTKINFKDVTGAREILLPDDFRRCIFFLMYIILSFFGTGNIASINSFDISWVRCFLTVFSPFTMMTLILLKTVIPFLLVTCSFRAINIVSQVKAENMFVIVLIYCDIMGLHFLFAVTNKGSWLEIGTSISHFVIMEVTVLFLAILYYIAQLYTDSTLVKKPSDTQPTIAPLWLPLSKIHPD